MVAGRRSHLMELVSRLAGVFVSCMGGVGLLGWTLEIETLKSVIPGMVTMKANTAACFVLGGLSLLSCRRARTSLGIGLATVVIAVAVMTLFEYLTGRDLGIDELLFRDTVSIGLGLPPGRMAMATAVAFAITGLSLILVACRSA